MKQTRTYTLELQGEMDWTRQRDWFNPIDHPDASVTVVGCGGIGSPTALGLSKLGIPKLTVIDYDEVEPHNVPNQFYLLSDVGQPKVQALGHMCEAFGGSEITMLEGKGQDFPDALKGIVVTGLDSMHARKEIWEKVKNNKEVDLLVDARIGGQDIVVMAFDPNDEAMQDYYENVMLFSDDDAVPAPCTARGIIDVSLQVASLITRQIRKYLAGQDVEYIITFSQDTLTIDVSDTKSKRKVVKAIESLRR